jgi:hypothetical protein
MDVVYVVGPQKENEELRYSLRSIAANLPHGRVWIVGYKPEWVANVEYLPTIQKMTRWQNSTANLLTACIHDEMPERFVYFNDDFYVAQPIPAVPTLHRGYVADVMRHYAYTSGRYVEGLKKTAVLLKELGYPDPLSYEVHAPMVVERRPMLDVLRLAADRGRGIVAIHKRTLYGNVYRIGGEQVDDVKVLGYGHSPPPGAFVSTSATSFGGKCGRWLRKLFPTPCQYER